MEEPKKPKFKRGTPEQIAFLSKIGKKGGRSRAEDKPGRPTMAEIGRRGGSSLHSKRGPEWFSDIGKRKGKNYIKEDNDV